MNPKTEVEDCATELDFAQVGWHVFKNTDKLCFAECSKISGLKNKLAFVAGYNLASKGKCCPTEYPSLRMT
jgi:hypothetical protein